MAEAGKPTHRWKHFEGDKCMRSGNVCLLESSKSWIEAIVLSAGTEPN
jgi:hypothetical protein